MATINVTVTAEGVRPEANPQARPPGKRTPPG
jgi:hypothetical protein